MIDALEIQEIARRVALPVRKLRYVIDQRILPGMRGRLQEERAGRPRAFTKVEGYFVGIAATLLDAGVQRGTITELLARLTDAAWPPPGADLPPPSGLQRAITQPKTVAEAMYLAPGKGASICLGDGGNLRFRLRGIDSGWVVPRRLNRLQDYRPRVVIELHLDSLYAAFFTSEPTARKPKRKSSQ
jgi:hypothetical protein